MYTNSFAYIVYTNFIILLIQQLCPSLLSTAMIKTMTNNFGRKQFTSLATPEHSPSWRKVRVGYKAGTWKQKLKQRPCRNAASCLPCSSWLSVYTVHSHLHQSLMGWMPSQTYLQANSIRAFSQLRFPPPRWPKLMPSWQKLNHY